MDQLIDPERKPALLERMFKESEMELGRASQKRESLTSAQRSSVVPSPIKAPAKFGQQVVREMPLEMVFQYLNINELYRLSWGAKNAHGEEWEKLKKGFDARLDKMKREALGTGWLKPQAVYGTFPCQSNGNDLLVYKPGTTDVLATFTFPRQPYGDLLCLSDYFASTDSGQMDLVAFQVVTIGQQATERFDTLQAGGDYSEAYFTHGLAVQTAEATAEYLHRHIKRELGIGEKQGKRYSWGYPAIPELEDHRKVFDLLPAVESELGMTLSPAYQLIPEQSTAAIIIHHKDARYYSVGESRVEQLMK
jgi:5-methyltetrahydrofolate--homocysteine methyltransferase